jgi:Zn finger protein HypA/HybF involved in hydrogenase expression
MKIYYAVIWCPMCSVEFFQEYTLEEINKILLEDSELQLECEECNHLITFKMDLCSTSER